MRLVQALALDMDGCPLSPPLCWFDARHIGPRCRDVLSTAKIVLLTRLTSPSKQPRECGFKSYDTCCKLKTLLLAASRIPHFEYCFSYIPGCPSFMASLTLGQDAPSVASSVRRTDPTIGSSLRPANQASSVRGGFIGVGATLLAVSNCELAAGCDVG